MIELKEVIRSKNVRRKVQLGVIPTVVSAIFAYGPHGLIGTYGFAESIAILSALIIAQVYLIAARVQLDFRSAA